MPSRRDKKPDAPNLLPTEGKKAADDPFVAEDPFADDAGADDAEADDPWAPSDVGPPKVAAAAPWVPSTGIPDPHEHEVEFVFGGNQPSGPRVKAPKVPRVAPAAVSRGPASRGPGGLSRGALAAIVVLLLLVAGVAAYALFFSDDEEPPVPTLAPTVAPTPAPTIVPTVPPVVLSEECLNSFLFAQAHLDEPKNLTRTTELCPTVEQWLEAAKRHPAAVGASSAEEVDNEDVQKVCASAPRSAMCRDAEDKGVLGGEGTAPSSPAPASPGGSPAGSPVASPTAAAGSV